ncbi:MAG: J domain-containing protein [Armatimonadota bacterium]
MPEKKNYYQILGVSRLATADQIKRRYRLLARKYHPDVAENKETARAAFIEINDAYQTLTNPDKRLLYDASLDKELLAFQARARAESAAGRSARQSGRPHTGTYNNQTHTYSSNVNTAEEARKKVVEAESAFIGRQFKTASAACKEAIRLDRRNARAYVILGDIYRIQGFDEQAISAYTVALQLDPRNTDVQIKLDRVARNRMDDYGYNSSESPSLLKVGLNLVSWVLAAAMLLYLHFVPGEPIPWLGENFKFISEWSSTLITSLFITGTLFGFIFSVNDWMHPLDDELVFQGVKSSGAPSASYPIGLVLLIFNIFNFYLAAAIYIIIGLVQESISKSVFRALAATFGVAALCALAYPVGISQVLLFGGNIAFPGLLIGWMIGDIIRPSW